MSKPHSFWIALLLLSAAPARAAEQHWIAVAPITNDAEVQRLTRMVDTRGRYDDIALVLGGNGTEEALKRLWPQTVLLGPELAGEALFVVTLLPDEILPPRPGVRVLRKTPTQAILGVAADSGIETHDLLPPHTAGGRRHSFHDGVAPVPLMPMQPARGSRHRPGSAGSGGGMHPAAPVADPRVQALVNAVVQANLDADVNYYSNTFHTRRSDQADGVNAQNDLLGRLQALGLVASLHSFNGDADNVIGDLPGTLEPDKVVIVGAHYDTINYAGAGRRSPGADDNGSGTAAVLELARVFTASGLSFRYTVRFVLFSSEEFGLVGSAAYAASLAASDVEVVAMLNTDMNAYRNPSDALDLDMVTNDTTGWLTSDLVVLSQLYVPALPVVTGTLSGGTSDHRSFFNQGYPAAFYFEDLDHDSPYIHSDQDTYGQSANDFGLAHLMVQSVAAGLGTYAEPVDLVLAHTELADTEDEWDPRVARTTVTSLIGTTPVACELHYDVGAGDVTVALTGSGTPDEWIGQIPGQPFATTVNYWFLATDSAGNSERLPREDAFQYRIGAHDRFYFDDFESGANGWTTTGNQNDWQLGTPMGLSTDPAAAYSGANCWGNDLGGAGFDGEYRSKANCWLLSPTIDATGKTHVHLRYARWLGVEDGQYDIADVRVAGNVHWTNPVGSGSDHLIDTSWVLHDLDVASSADNRAAFHLRFNMNSDAALEFGGFNVDDVEMYALVPGVEPELWRDVGVISLSSGGTTQLQLALGPGGANRTYVLFAGVSGTVPGFDFGQTHVDLNFDAVTLGFLQLLPVLPGFFGVTDAAGRASATLALPPGLDPSLAGTTLSIVGVTLGPPDHATPPIAIHVAE